MDLPAPVSPVSTVKPGRNARSSLSISKTSRIDRPTSIASPDPVEPAGVFLRTDRILALDQGIAVGVPLIARIVEAEDGGHLLGLIGQAERGVALGQALERLRHMGGGLVIVDDAAIAVDRRQI